MVKVITYGSYDLLHYGHVRLLERAKALGDYLIVGVTSDDYEKARGKINLQQSLMERVESVKATGLADEIVVEEYEGQKIDDIKRYGIDIFTVGSDWEGKFDYLNEYCKVIYLPRTEGVSSSEIREKNRSISLGLVGDADFMNKVANESAYVNGIHLTGICTKRVDKLSERIRSLNVITESYEELLNACDAIYIRSKPDQHYYQIKKALEKRKHVLCESPICLKIEQLIELKDISESNNCALMEAIKTAYSTAYNRLLLLLKAGKIGKIVSVNATCTSLIERGMETNCEDQFLWDGIYEWGPTALLPIFQVLGIDFVKQITAVKYRDEDQLHDDFVKADFIYNNSVASMLVGNGVKAEGDLIIAGTQGYIYVPAPWWKTDYFEVRYEDIKKNKRYFYQLEGEGIRYELVAFSRSIEKGKISTEITWDISSAIVQFMEGFSDRNDVMILND